MRTISRNSAAHESVSGRGPNGPAPMTATRADEVGDCLGHGLKMGAPRSIATKS